MTDENFIDFIFNVQPEDFEDKDWAFDEEWENESEKFYNQRNNKSNNSNPTNDDDLPF